MKTKKQIERFFSFNSITTQNLLIEDLSLTDWKRIAESLLYENSYFARTWGISKPNDFKKYYQKLIQAKKEQNGLSFVFHDRTSKNIVGITSFSFIEWQNKYLEMGGNLDQSSVS